MLAGVGKRIITPSAGVDLAGFGRLDRKNIGVHDDLYVNALALQQDEKRTLIICADIIGFGFDLTQKIKKDINCKYGFNEDEILLSASHTHSGPQTLENMLVTLGKWNEDYIGHFLSCVMSSVESALKSMEEVDIYLGKTQCNIGINRRLIKDGKANFQPNEEGAADKSVTVLKLMKGDTTKAVLFSYACHPSTIGDDFVSADYPGVAKKVVEYDLGKGAVALFMQECCGNIRVRTIKGNDFRGGTWKDVREFGIELGAAVSKLCSGENGEMKKLDKNDLKISTAIMHMQLPTRGKPQKEGLEKVKNSGNIHEQLWAERMLNDYANLNDTVPFTIQRIALNNDFSIIAMSGEVCVEYGLYLKNMDAGKTIISAAYSNGVSGYIPTEEMFEQG
ncbi:MAG TPA: neutral/alkaline non-lysosomal ceramidase N-terminal domain-containing protein, partial [Clostridiales bacterium]|nr:neutral/alkaline non-lysosomal ceramidase N-terminal domain-containing protein [Clostridiales bacterium]